MVRGRRRAMSARVALEKMTYRGTPSSWASFQRVAFRAAIRLSSTGWAAAGAGMAPWGSARRVMVTCAPRKRTSPALGVSRRVLCSNSVKRYPSASRAAK